MEFFTAQLFYNLTKFACAHTMRTCCSNARYARREDLKRRANCTRLTLPRDAAPRRPLGTPVLASSPPARRPQRGVGYVGEPVGARGSHGTQRLPDEATRVLAGCVASCPLTQADMRVARRAPARRAERAVPAVNLQLAADLATTHSMVSAAKERGSGEGQGAVASQAAWQRS